jgi:pimeloyl-ACP methyl ester carboxylesterase
VAARRRFEVVETRVTGRRMSARRPLRSPRRSRPVVVFVAGLGLSGRYLLPVADSLGQRLPVWVPDLPGFGRSDAPATALDMAGLGDAVVAWMDSVGLASAALVGNSMGCQVAVEAAARHPHRISSLVLEGPTMDATARSVVRHAGRVAVDAFREPLSLGPLQVLDWIGTGPRRLIATTRHAFAHGVEDRLPAVTSPALVVRGERDPIVPQCWAERVAAGLPLGSLRVVAGGSHAMAYSRPDVLADVIEDFVAGAHACSG